MNLRTTEAIFRSSPAIVAGIIGIIYSQNDVDSLLLTIIGGLFLFGGMLGLILGVTGRNLIKDQNSIESPRFFAVLFTVTGFIFLVFSLFTAEPVLIPPMVWCWVMASYQTWLFYRRENIIKCLEVVYGEVV